RSAVGSATSGCRCSWCRRAATTSGRWAAMPRRCSPASARGPWAGGRGSASGPEPGTASLDSVELARGEELGLPDLALLVLAGDSGGLAAVILRPISRGDVVARERLLRLGHDGGGPLVQRDDLLGRLRAAASRRQGAEDQAGAEQSHVS